MKRLFISLLVVIFLALSFNAGSEFMKLIKIEPGKYHIEGYPQVTVERWKMANTYWDIFLAGSVFKNFGTYETLNEFKAELKKYNSIEELLKLA